jgi:hypothetical protein
VKFVLGDDAEGGRLRLGNHRFSQDAGQDATGGSGYANLKSISRGRKTIPGVKQPPGREPRGRFPDFPERVRDQ